MNRPIVCVTALVAATLSLAIVQIVAVQDGPTSPTALAPRHATVASDLWSADTGREPAPPEGDTDALPPRRKPPLWLHRAL